MLKNVKWEQSGINRDVKPPIGDGKGFVAPSATPYRQILELDLPEDFSGKDALIATQKGMDACYSGANELPGILSGIGRGMTLKDNASYAGLMKLFDATNQTIGRSSLAASIYQQRGFVPTQNDIDQILVYAAGGGEGIPPVGGTGELDPLLLATLPGGGNPTGAYNSPYYDYDWTQAGPIPFLNEKPDWGAIGQGLVTGAKTIGFGFVSGFAGFFGDTIGGVGGFLATSFGNDELAYQITKAFDFSGQVDALARQCGVNTDCLLYTGSKVAGQITANVATNAFLSTVAAPAAAANLGTAGKAVSAFISNSNAVNATVYGFQAYGSTYRGAIDSYLANKGVSSNQITRSSTFPETAKLTKYLSEEDYVKARSGAVTHGIINATTAGVGAKITGTEMSTYAKVGGNLILHGAGNYANQYVDKNFSKTRDSYSAKEAVTSAALSGVTTYIGEKTGLNYSDNTGAKNDSTGASMGSKVINGLKRAGEETIKDSTGGQHSYTISFVNQVFN